MILPSRYRATTRFWTFDGIAWSRSSIEIKHLLLNFSSSYLREKDRQGRALSRSQNPTHYIGKRLPSQVGTEKREMIKKDQRSRILPGGSSTTSPTIQEWRCPSFFRAVTSFSA